MCCGASSSPVRMDYDSLPMPTVAAHSSSNSNCYFCRGGIAYGRIQPDRPLVATVAALRCWFESEFLLVAPSWDKWLLTCYYDC
jgi:hypothetical protein